MKFFEKKESFKKKKHSISVGRMVRAIYANWKIVPIIGSCLLLKNRIMSLCNILMSATYFCMPIRWEIKLAKNLLSNQMHAETWAFHLIRQLINRNWRVYLKRELPTWTYPTIFLMNLITWGIVLLLVIRYFDVFKHFSFCCENLFFK